MPTVIARENIYFCFWPLKIAIHTVITVWNKILYVDFFQAVYLSSLQHPVKEIPIRYIYNRLVQLSSL